MSFIRFGESPASKSQTLHALLGKQKNEVFFIDTVGEAERMVS